MGAASRNEDAFTPGSQGQAPQAPQVSQTHAQYLDEDEHMNEKAPDNHGKTLPFHALFEDLFYPLQENLKKPTGPVTSRKRLGPHAGLSKNPHEVRKAIIERFISRWRQDVGEDIYPAFRLIMPEKDRERAMYGIKEKALAKFLIKIMKIDKNSEDAYNLTNWKLGQSKNAGDFAGRCYDVISKRALLVEPGDMTIAEVNDGLNQLSLRGKEDEQLLVMEGFYKRMNAMEMMWLIRIILRSMKVGATEKTFLDLWHPDAETLFNVSSSLKKVCWDLHDPNVRLESEERSISLMQCYQPQLAYGGTDRKKRSFNAMITAMRMTEHDQEFWIEEKLDGERMQLHIKDNPGVQGGKEFRFWSRKAKEYTYLYGNHFYDTNSALTRHLKEAFDEGVDNIILDSEMITWDPDTDAMVPFGTLKTAALAEQKNPFAGGQRPLYRVFDILYLNDRDLTRYTLRDRRRALEASIKPVHRRLELLHYRIGKTTRDIEESLQKVVEEASEGLVLKNPRSAYKLNQRLDDWVKVKPEYMTEFGESLDCLIIGGYYGTGHRGGNLSSFLCGLREDRNSSDNESASDSKSHRFLSFFKVGGGMSAHDYQGLRHHTDGKWKKWDPKNPPTDYIELAGGSRQIERPDMWIMPQDSLVVEVKAASVNGSEDYATLVTLRFPRFKKFRSDKDWKTALSFNEFLNLRQEAETERRQKVDEAKKMDEDKRKQISRAKKTLTIAGYANRPSKNVAHAEAKSNVFRGLTIFVMTEALRPSRKSKVDLEEMVKANGGRIVQATEVKEKGVEHPPDVICVAERRTVKVASLQKQGKKVIVRPQWLFDCIEQGNQDFAKGLTEVILPLEVGRHIFFMPDDQQDVYNDNLDEYGDSYARDVQRDELRALMANMKDVEIDYDADSRTRLMDAGDARGAMFFDLTIYFDVAQLPQLGADMSDAESLVEVPAHPQALAAQAKASFAGATIAEQLDDDAISHIVVSPGSDLRKIRKKISVRKRVPRIVTLDWIEQCWKEGTRLDEERFVPLK